MRMMKIAIVEDEALFLDNLQQMIRECVPEAQVKGYLFQGEATISELEQEGLLDRDVQDGNRYRALLSLTQQGQLAAEQVETRAKLAVEKAGSGMTDAQRATFYEVLNLIAGHLQEICEEGLENA